MPMIYLTGDKHGDYSEVAYFCKKQNTTKDDLLIVLGDNGVNYWGGSRDKKLKERLEALPITFMMIRGNHDQRPSRQLYREQKVNKRSGLFGDILVQDKYPSLLFAQDGYGYWLGDKKVNVLGGAYSVDKYYRLEMQEQGHTGWRWFPDEQMSEKERTAYEKLLQFMNNECCRMPSIILSHTCPYKYIPRDLFLPNLDQSTVDDSMEHWLDKINDMVKPQQWFCGHWHTDRTVDNVRFLYNDFIELK